jgi:hypothetical protein
MQAPVPGEPYTPGDLEPVIVNGKEFKVVDAISNSNGFTAFALYDEKSNTTVVVFQGSYSNDVGDIIQDAELGLPMTPSQFKDAEDYLKNLPGRLAANYHNEAYPPVSLVAGNSLGGGLALHVGLQNPDIHVVTVNPAPVPSPDELNDAPNVHNYVVNTEILHTILEDLGIVGRTPGSNTTIPGTGTGMDSAIANHMGLTEPNGGDSLVSPFSLAWVVAFSIFHENLVLTPGDYGGKVDVTPHNLQLIINALHLERTHVDGILQARLPEIANALQRYQDTTEERERASHQAYIDHVTTLWQPARDVLEDIVKWIDEHLLIPIIAYPSPRPSSVVADALVIAIRALCSTTQNAANAGVIEKANEAWRAYAQTFIDSAKRIADQVDASNDQMQTDLDLARTRWTAVSDYTQALHDTITATDANIQAAIAAGTCLPDVINVRLPPWPAGVVQPIGNWGPVCDAAYIETQRQEAIIAFLSNVVARLVTLVTALLESVLLAVLAAFDTVEAAIVVFLASIEVAIAAAELAVSAAIGALEVAQRAARIVSLGHWDAFDTQIDAARADHDALVAYRQGIDSIMSTFRTMARGWREYITTLMRELAGLPNLAHDLSPILIQSLFSDDEIENIQYRYNQCKNILNVAATSFDEITYQYTDHKALAIDKLANRANQTSTDLFTIVHNITEITT